MIIKRNRFIGWIMHLWFLWSRPMTLGVRLIVENEAGEVLLVRHTYVPGWYLPGGGVEHTETQYEAAEKELLEEASIQNTGKLELIAVYKNQLASKRDHVTLFKCHEWVAADAFEPNKEIEAIGFFPVNELPSETTAATQRRIDEVYGNAPISPYW